MKGFGCFFRKVITGSLISGFKVGERSGEGIKIFHLLLENETLLFCDTCLEQLGISMIHSFSTIGDLRWEREVVKGIGISHLHFAYDTLLFYDTYPSIV